MDNFLRGINVSVIKKIKTEKTKTTPKEGLHHKTGMFILNIQTSPRSIPSIKNNKIIKDHALLPQKL